jgi:putative ABC transport system permease protein
MLVGADVAFTREHADLAWITPPPEAFDPASNTNLAFVSESFTERFSLKAGDALIVPTPTGPRTLRLVGVFADYGNERGSIVVERSHLIGWFGADQASSVILKLHPGTDADSVRASILAEHPGLSVFTNAHLRREILRIFGQTFAITYALEFIGVVVAVIGLAMTLASLLLQRRPELTTLRALGLSHGEIARAAALEGALTAFAGLLAGLVVSLALGWLLIFVINKQTFGWTLQQAWPVAGLTALGALVLLAGTGVALWVGRWGAKLPADREE